MRKAIRVVVILAILLVVVVGGFLAYQTITRSRVQAEIERESPAAGIAPISDLGATKTLEILPLVENAAAGPQYQSEHGVSYLVKTDSATILLDVGYNLAGSDPSPLEHNMAELGVKLGDVDAIVISHWHPDHVGGSRFWSSHTFSVGNRQGSLGGKRVYVPSPMTYPGLTPAVATQPVKVAEGVASIGILPFAEVIDLPGQPMRNAEQALAVNVAGRGVVLITGCGHPTLPRLVARTQAVTSEPIAGVVGGLHLTGAPDSVVQGDVDLLQSLNAQLVGLSPHDSDASVIDRFRAAVPAAYQDVMVGRAIRIASPGV